jgi:hypothetical protein
MTRFTPSKTKSEAEGLVRRWIDAALWRQEAQLAETDGFAFLQPDEIKGMDRQDAIELDGLMRFQLSLDRKTAVEGSVSNVEKVFDSSRKETHWGKRKLKRDE